MTSNKYTNKIRDVSKQWTNVGERHGSSKISLQNREFEGFGERWRMSNKRRRIINMVAAGLEPATRPL